MMRKRGRTTYKKLKNLVYTTRKCYLNYVLNIVALFDKTFFKETAEEPPLKHQWVRSSNTDNR